MLIERKYTTMPCMACGLPEALELTDATGESINLCLDCCIDHCFNAERECCDCGKSQSETKKRIIEVKDPDTDGSTIQICTACANKRC